MKVTSYAVARPSYYDRNATSYAGAFDTGGVAPHAPTTRVTTTVAAGRKLLIELVYILGIRGGVAAPVGEVSIYQSVASGASSIPLVRVTYTNNTTGTAFSTQAAGALTIYPGEVYACGTYDNSTGGNNTYVIGVKGTQYDA